MKTKKQIKQVLLVKIAAGFLFAGSLFSQNTKKEYESEDETPFWEVEMMKPGGNFFEIQKQANAYFEKFYSKNKKKNGEEAADDLYAKYARWEWYWKDRVLMDGQTPGSFRYVSDAAQQYMNASTQKGSNPVTAAINPSNWTELGPFSQPGNAPSGQNMGIITAVAVRKYDFNTVYAGSNSGGIFKSTNGGSTWSPKMDNVVFGGVGINDIMIDPNSTNENTVYAASGTYARFNPYYGTGVLKSTDGGTTWNQTALVFAPSAEKIVWKMAMNPSNTQEMYAVTSSDVYKTTNGWTSMSIVTPSGASDLWDVEYDPVNPTNVFVSGKKIFRFNGSWTDVTTNLAGVASVNGAIRIEVTATSTLYAFYIHNSTKYLKKSIDGGTTWTFISNPSGPLLDIFEVNVNDDRVMYSGGANSSSPQLYKSVNGGVTWFTIANSSDMHTDQRALFLYDPIYNSGSPGSTDKMVLGCDGGVCKSIVGGGIGNWSNINGTGLANLQFYGMAGSERYPQYISTGAQDNGHYLYSNGSWIYHADADAYENVYDRVNPGTVYMVASAGFNASDPIKKYTSYGAVTAGSLGAPSDLYDVIDKPLVIDNTNRLYTGNRDVFYYTGSGWSAISSFIANNNVTSGKRIRALSVAESDYNTIYVAMDGPSWNNPNDVVMLKTTNRGTTWTDISPDNYILWEGIMDIEIDPTNALKLWASLSGFSGNRVIQSTDGGLTWTNFSTGLPNFPVSDLIFQVGTTDGLYAATDVGVYFYDGAVSSWVPFRTNLPLSAQAADLDINYCSGKIRASVYGRGLWESPLAAQSTVVQQITSSQTWSGEVNLNSDIEICSTCTLTVTGTVNVPENKSIFIKKGGLLILDGVNGGGKITNYCGKMWNGIFVEGTSNQPQVNTSSAQAKIILRNGAIIENSHNGIANYGLTNGNIDWNKTGGIIDCSNSKFFNNRRAAEFQSYSFANSISKFSNCLFETTQLLNNQVSYPNNVGIEAFVTINDVDGILFEDNSFKNSVFTGSVVANYGKGITANESIITVQKNTAADGNYFYNLFRGVEVTRTSATSGTVNILNNKFEQNRLGVYLLGNAQLTEIRGNNFTKTGLPTSGVTDAYYGILTDAARDYNIVDNAFTNMNYAVFTKNSSASTEPDCNIYSNDFYDNYRSVVSQYNNYKLNIKCNTFKNQSGVAQMYWLNYNGIGNQGFCGSSTTSPAANLFYEIPVQKDIYNFTGATYFTYYYHNSSVSGYTSNELVPILYVSSTCSVSPCSLTFDPNTSCDYVLPKANSEGNTGSGMQTAKLNEAGSGNSDSEILYNKIISQMKNSGLTPHELSAADLELLHKIALEDETVTGANARGLFTFFFGENFENYLPEINEETEEAAMLSSKPMLFQNKPNPFTQQTEIKVFLPEKKGVLEICSVYGGFSKKYDLDKELNTITLSSDLLPKGMYIYTLKIDGNVIDSKKMLVQ